MRDCQFALFTGGRCRSQWPGSAEYTQQARQEKEPHEYQSSILDSPEAALKFGIFTNFEPEVGLVIQLRTNSGGRVQPDVFSLFHLYKARHRGLVTIVVWRVFLCR
jgi:hypothetical protein